MEALRSHIYQTNPQWLPFQPIPSLLTLGNEQLCIMMVMVVGGPGWLVPLAPFLQIFKKIEEATMLAHWYS